MTELFEFIRAKIASGTGLVLATVIRTDGSVPAEPGKKMALSADGEAAGTVGGGLLEAETLAAARDVLASGEPRILVFELDREKAGSLGMLCGGRVEIFLDPLNPRPSLLIMGGGHVGLALARLASVAGYSYAVADDREEFLAPERFPDAGGRYLVDFARLGDEIPFGKESFVVIATRGHAHDRDCLRRALASEARYIGMIGSLRKVASTLEALEAEGIKAGLDSRVYAPIGLDLGDDSPEEIAVSILSEIVLVRSGGSGRHLRAGAVPGGSKAGKRRSGGGGKPAGGSCRK